MHASGDLSLTPPQTLLLPLSLASILYILLAHLLLPFVRRHRSRYAQYLPMSMQSPSSWRTRLSDALYNLFAPGAWTRDARVDHHHDDELFDDEEGEGMVGFDPLDERRREALEQRRSLVEQQRVGRELEEGFRDDSEDEEGE
jgi:hypothetical protein